jgi:hypothetical protein
MIIKFSMCITCGDTSGTCKHIYSVLQEGSMLIRRPNTDYPFKNTKPPIFTYANIDWVKSGRNGECQLTLCPTYNFDFHLLTGRYSNFWVMENWMIYKMPKIELVEIDEWYSRLKKVD